MKAIKWNFDAKSNRATFDLLEQEVANEPFTVISAKASKKDATRTFSVISVGTKKYMMEDGDLNESIGWDKVVDSKSKAKGLLIVKDNAVITVSGGIITFATA